MKKFTQYQEQKINENKLYDRYLELADELATVIRDFVQENTSVDLTDGSPDLNEELHDLISEFSDGVIHKAMLGDQN